MSVENRTIDRYEINIYLNFGFDMDILVFDFEIFYLWGFFHVFFVILCFVVVVIVTLRFNR